MGAAGRDSGMELERNGGEEDSWPQAMWAESGRVRAKTKLLARPSIAACLYGQTVFDGNWD